MTQAQTGQVSTEAAELYETLFVPALFAGWPPRLLAAAAVGRGDQVLDVGCGTGVLARAAAEAVGPDGRVVGLDPNDGMLAVAARQAPGIRWTKGTAESMPFGDGSFDAVVSQFALMFFADRAGAAVEMARVLRPGGRLAVATWAEVDASPGYAALVGLLRTEFGDPPADALLAPFCVGTETLLREALAPGFGPVAVERVPGMARFTSVDAWVDADIRAWTLRELLDEDQVDLLHRRARERLSVFAGPDGSVEFPVPALVATAVRDGRR